MILLSVCATAFAQPGRQSKRDKVEQLRIAFLSEELSLTVEEGQQFWPLFNAFEKEKKELKMSHKKLVMGMNEKGSSITNSEVQKFVTEMEARRQSEAQLEAKFLHDCLPILGAERTVKLLQAEDKFRRALLKEKMR